ncbi:globin domain-containing protein [Streptomyces sp. NPDC050516]|uniref:globin domain-containing protein n=1 Tax=Streptomyces sp. NPDC050516 TaxID=3365621 RepID=UPI0037881173
MDAPTTTGDNGSSGGSNGERGWFTPPNKSSASPGGLRSDERDGDAGSTVHVDTQNGKPRSVPNPVRPVGNAAERIRRPAAPPEPAPPSRREDGPGYGGNHAPARDAATADESGPPPDEAEPTDASSDPASGSWPAAALHHTPSPAASDSPEPDPEADAQAGPEADAAPRAASPTAVLIRRTMAEIEPVADKVTSYFYALLFVRHPELRALFPVAMDTQRDRLFKALLTAAEHVDDADTLGDYLSHLGRGHRKYGTRPEHYPAVGECLLGALARYAPDTWNADAEAAWIQAYTAISQIMIDAAAEDEALSPAWWHAEVVSHELRTPDIAVVTVRPDQPYPFLAGQYTTLETPWWPRVWRHYSFASAPRSDGLLSFHVKAVPAGWVSGALVHRARPGDVIRLGPPAGSMTVDHTTDNGLLCLGGGTGIAPIRALVEDVAEHGRRRLVDVFYGARSGSDLYDIDPLLTLARRHPWLSVRPVVATGPAGGEANSISGQLPDAVRQYGPWRAYDAYLSGPAAMVRSGVDALVGAGMPSNRIRHDFIEELVMAGD